VAKYPWLSQRTSKDWHPDPCPVYTIYLDTRAQILASARAAFDRHGLEGLSLRDVAKDVGITPMAIYRHFENKQALIDALVLDALAAWSERAMSVPKAEPLVWLKKIGEAFLDFALREPRRFEAAFLIHSPAARRYPDDFTAGRSPAGTLQLQIIKDAMARGLLVKTSAVEVLLTIAASSQGLVSLYRAGRIAGGESEFRALYRRGMQRCIKSFQPEKRR
jgi:AcrR family transcriptional regulator